ncbi:MAG: polymerase delta subunit [Candidatus Parcubacteria bacterium]|jgi:hypothetical protein
MNHHAVVFRVDSVQDFVIENDGDLSEVYDVYTARFGIDDARTLVLKAYSRPAETASQCLIVRSDFITLEAQNALLKIVEEPPVSTHFRFVLPTDFTILPTLASRFSDQSSKTLSASEQSEIFRVFLTNGYKDRIIAIELAAKQKDVVWQRAIKRGLIQFVEQSSNKKALAALEYVTRLLLTRGASNKMLLEHAALLL